MKDLLDISRVLKKLRSKIDSQFSNCYGSRFGYNLVILFCLEFQWKLEKKLANNFSLFWKMEKLFSFNCIMEFAEIEGS